jgi:mannose-1-phosphate guanylyltransferase
MPSYSNWAAILAGGEGQRLRSFAQSVVGEDRPKQFCRFFGTQTLLGATRDRVCLNVEPSRTLYVVTRAHEAFYQRELHDVPKWQLIEQPSNRGTTVAVAATIARLRAIGADGVVGLFPADHYYRDWTTLQRNLAAAYELSATNPHSVALLGAEPDRPETDYGWIEPGYRISAGRMAVVRVASVKRFVEKPSIDVAQTLMADRCLWNTMVVIGRIHAFEQLLASAAPDLWDAFSLITASSTPQAEERLMEEIYRSLPASDFSRDVLATQPDRLTVISLPPVGWTDLGHPARVLDVMAKPQAAAASHAVAG